MNPTDPLKPLLASWRHEPTPLPQFEAEVWSRLHSADSNHPISTVFRFPAALPLAASIAVLLSIAAGTSTAVALNQSQSTERMADAYVRSVDPLQMSTAHSNTHS
jgi:hypothetical protein